MNDYSSSSSSSAPKKRRLPGSCDLCKAKRSDSAKMPGGICSNCLELQIDCKDNGRIRPTLPGMTTGTEDHEHRDIRNLVSTVLSTSTPYTVPNDYSAIRLTIVELSRYIQTLEREIINLHSYESGARYGGSQHAGNILPPHPRMPYPGPQQGPYPGMDPSTFLSYPAPDPSGKSSSIAGEVEATGLTPEAHKQVRLFKLRIIFI
ncbi:hypothetical protein C8J56DRAFT_884699 [Mycena floridula]|nr:hypothetical protein C8J56DRAFT_884699 [Mycena floridula]